MLDRWKAALKDRLPLRREAVPLDAALREGVAWIHRAQDATPDRGVSHSYLLGRGWMPSYPETTGYIIPTLLNWSRVSGDEESRERSLEMARWELEIQDPGGGIQGSVVGSGDGKPVVFNTGQVLFGWLAAHRETGDSAFRDAGDRAVAWLLSGLDGRDTWVTHGNMGRDEAHTYNIRVVWAVLAWARTLDMPPTAREAMDRVVNWTLAQELENGWFKLNCLNNNEAPLLHTIAYTARGLLECGLILENSSCVEAARRTADAVAERIGEDGRLPGRFDSRWHGSARWSCLTGMAQMAIVWQKLERLYPDSRYGDAASEVLSFLRRIQDAAGKNPGIRGGIAGSHPVDGEYGRYRMLNWAVKFYVDGMLGLAHPETLEDPAFHPG